MSHTPAAQGYFMPAEWAPRQATWIAWPHHAPDWPGKFAPIPWVYADIVRHVYTGERVNILVNDGASEKKARAILTKNHVDLQQVAFFQVPTDRIWTRDYGPIFVTNSQGQVGYVQWRFNGWAKYDDCQRDAAVVDRLHEVLQLPHWTAQRHDQPVVLEGGSIDVNGAGMLLTTEECLLSPVQARNPHLTREDIEQVFADYLGVKKTLWLGKGIEGDDTHGHVDDLTRFVAPDRVVTVVEENKNDPNYEPLQENLRRLQGITDLSGKPLEIVRLPMPGPVFFHRQRLPASYANFYIAAEKVLVPTFNDPADRLALGILAELFPGRTVVGIHARDLVLGLGTLHCLTQQQPAANTTTEPRTQ